MVALTDPGCQRDHNEDTYWVPTEQWPTQRQIAECGALYLVADGMGGYQAGEVASEMAVKVIATSFYANSDHDRAMALHQAIIKANDQIFQAAQADPARAQMGTTVVAVVVYQGTLSVAHVGDSRAYLWRSGELHPLTEDHSWVAERLKMGILTAEEAAHHRYRNIVTRSLGKQPKVKPTISKSQWQPGDVALLCSDGLTGQVPDQEIASILKTIALPQVAQTLINQANAAGGPDNITAVIVTAPDAPEMTEVKRPQDLSPDIGTQGPFTSRFAGWQAAAGILLLIGLSTACFWLGHGFWPDERLFSSPATTATATLTPTLTPSPTFATTPSPPPHTSTAFDFHLLGQVMNIPVSSTTRIDDWGECFIRPPWSELFLARWKNEAHQVCLKPRPPYGIILAGRVTEELTTTFQLKTGTDVYVVNFPREFELNGSLADQSVLQVRIFGFLTASGKEIRALRLEISTLDGKNRRHLSSLPGGDWRGWFYLRADSEVARGILSLQAAQTKIVAVYLELVTDSQLPENILTGPYGVEDPPCHVP